MQAFQSAGESEEGQKLKQATGEKNRRRVQTVCVVGLCVIFLSSQWGCATHRTSHRMPTAQLGKLGVVSAQYTPAFEFELPAKGWLGGARRGAVEGTSSFIRLVPQVVVGGATIFLGPIGLVGVLYAAGAAVAGAGYMIVGPFYGAITAQDAEMVEESEGHLKAALSSMRIQETMRDHVAQEAQSLSNVA